ncbi:L-rhamnose/proton symporter RhaT [Enterococcus nangangensis]|uniref:L-rhamnose/proton symporter RhaT n=1 Tax=Enterococcus nangangensis TaxID=2559926 RepID=UPI0010F602AA|nr:L-rhamnose/proton symporter RhaT [Enterococcus nangangensis]
MIQGLLVLITAGFFQGTFGLGMKKYTPFSWEAFWALFSVVSMILVPLIWISIEIPNFGEYLISTPVEIILPVVFCGFIWGITAIGFGKAIDTIGMSLTYGISMGSSAAIGSLVPLFMNSSKPTSLFLVFFLLGLCIMLCGVVFLTKAGLVREQATKKNNTLNRSKFNLGLVIALASGIGSAAQNIGFSYADYTSKLAIADGVSGKSASLLGWLIIFLGGFIANFTYPLFLLFKNHKFSDYKSLGAKVGFFKVMATGMIWFAALGFYGKATFLLGNYGTVVGWIGFNALALIISSIWGLIDHEWQSSIRAKKIMFTGNAILIISWIVIGLTNYVLS